MTDDTRPTILVVDDDAMHRLYGREILTEAGYQVIEADSAEAALKMLEERSDIRLLFSDVQMPGDDGVDLSQRTRDRWPHIPLLLTSGGPRIDGDRFPHRCRFIAKPYSEYTVLGHVRGLMADLDVAV